MTNITRRRAKAFCLTISALTVFGALPALSLDLTLPIGARETASERDPAGTYDLPVGGWTADKGVPAATLDGEVIRRAWRMPGGLTTGQVLGPLRDQLLSEGFDVFFECTARSCGGFDFRFETEVLPAPAMYVDLSDFRFLSAKGADASEALSLLISRDGDSVFAQVIQVGPPGRTSLSVSATGSTAIAVAPDDLIGQLETIGHVVLTDLVFASGSASLGDGSLGSLDTLVEYLTTNPTRQITFVGHTDATGSLEANVALSRRRANAARSYIVDRGVPAAQVAADGVGYLSPRASNLTQEGRDTNRRVEAVLISTE